MEPINLAVEKREEKGKTFARLLRAEGKIPANLYGAKMDPISLALDPGVLRKTLDNPYRRNTLLSLEVDGAKYVCLVQEVQTDPVSDKVKHVDFFAVAEGQRITRKVALKTVGKSIGLSRGGQLFTFRRVLSVTCLPQDLPEAIEIDITELDVDDGVTVGDIPKVEGVVFNHKDTLALVQVATARELITEEEEEEEEVEGEEGAEGEAVEGEEKKEGAEQASKE